MKKLLFTLLTIITVMSVKAQDAEFTTSHANVGGQSTKMEMKFQVYQDSLVLNYTDKKTVKMLSRMGQPTKMVMPYKMIKDSTATYIQYIHKADDVNVMVITKGAKPSVKIQTRDTFTGYTTDQLYYNM